jgi:hypothetical protein
LAIPPDSVPKAIICAAIIVPTAQGVNGPSLRLETPIPATATMTNIVTASTAVTAAQLQLGVGRTTA